MEHEFRIRAELVRENSVEQRKPMEELKRMNQPSSAPQHTAAADPAHCDPVRSAAGDEQADGAGRRNKLGAGGNSEDPARTENTYIDLTPVQQSLAEMQRSLTEMNKLLERVGNLSEKYSSKWIDWLPDFSLLVALKWIMLVLILGTAALAGWYGAAAIRGLFL
ncbi:MAG: hypothetical protein ACLUS6_15525 [Dysosmobacter sp.]